MKALYAILAFAWVALLPGVAWAQRAVAVVQDVNTPSFKTTAVNSGLTAVATGASAASLAYLSTYELNGSLANGLAAIPGYAPTTAAILAKTQNRTDAQQIRLEELRGSMRQEAEIIDLSPKTIQKFFDDLRSGDIGSQLRESLENKWQSIKDELAGKFTQEALDAAMENFIDDLLNCRTPQLDVLFPSINLDLGLTMCDYGQLFNNMKSQVDGIIDRGWGGQFNINGRPVSEIIKDPDALKDAIELVPPSQGHSLVIDFLSDQSINASYQAKIDANSIVKQLAQVETTRELMKKFRPRTIVDAQDATTDTIAKVGQMENALSSAQLGVGTTELELKRLEMQKQAQQEMLEQNRKAAENISAALAPVY